MIGSGSSYVERRTWTWLDRLVVPDLGTGVEHAQFATG